jgi:L-ascorbate metabolism protein UlaG (beta-lactamase superfamily)
MDSLTVTRVTHSCAVLDFGGTRLLTDPWFSERAGYRRTEPLGMLVTELPHLDGVVVSHAHYDHYDMEAFKAYPDKNVPLYVVRETAAAARKAGFTNVIELEAWQRFDVGPVAGTATPAKHGVPEITYVLQWRGMTVFFGGDTLFIPELRQVAERFPTIDLALVPVNGLRIRPALNRQVVMNAREAAQLCALLRPRVAVPIHYAFSGGPLADRLLLKYDGTAEEFAREAARVAPATEVRVLSPGEPSSLVAAARAAP